MKSFDRIINESGPSDKTRVYGVGTPQNRWANVIREFFGSSGIVVNRGAETMSNIDAIENITNNEEQFLTLLQRILPQGFSWGEQPALESAEIDEFSTIIQEMIPISDEDRADLKRMTGRNIPESEIAALVGDPVTFLELVQQEFPEYNIQLEGWADFKLNAQAKALGARKAAGDFIGNTAIKGIEKTKDAGRYLWKNKKDRAKTGINAVAKGIDRGVDRMASVLKGDGSIQPGTFGDLIASPSGSRASERGEGSEKEPETETEPEKKPDFYDDFNQNSTDKTRGGVEAMLRNYNVDDATLTRLMGYITHIPGQPVKPAGLIRIRDELRALQLSEDNLKMKTFNDIIRDTGKTIMEAPEDEAPMEAPPEEVAPEAPPVEPVEELAPDDIDKLQVDMLELVRRALIINPSDIDRTAYAKLTTQVSFDTIDELKPLLNKLVQNHYPDLEMGDVEPGPGV
jgi:hypothetical protein